jgi:hypothetical protein
MHTSEELVKAGEEEKTSTRRQQILLAQMMDETIRNDNDTTEYIDPILHELNNSLMENVFKLN